MAMLLVCERNPAVRRRLQDFLQGQGHDTLVAGNRAEMLKQLDQARPAAAVIGQTGSYTLDTIELARDVRSQCRDLPIVLFISESSEDLAISALKAGVQGYVKQPCFEELAAAIAECLGRPDSAMQSRPRLGAVESTLLGSSPELSRIRDYVRKVAATECNVLITGETGTGKELVAEAIHRNSPRRSRPFVVINCAAIPDALLESELFGYERGAFTGAVHASGGKFSEAGGGTIFLDEVGDMSLHLQAKILRAIEAKEVQRLGARGTHQIDVRILAATNQNLEQMIGAGRFRSDLYFRLAVTRVRLPALRERPEDVPLLAQYFLDDLNRRLSRPVEGMTNEVMEKLVRHSWPGNVRELKNLIESFAVAGEDGWICLEDLPESLQEGGDHGPGPAVEERIRILSALRDTNWNKSKAASALRWSRMTLYRKLARYRIVRDFCPKPKSVNRAGALGLGA